MSDNFALNENEQIIVEPSTKPLRIYIARQISTLLSPMVISLPLIVLVAHYHTSNMLTTSIYAGLVFFFLSIGPMAYILIGVHLGKFTDVDVSQRTQRIGPFLFGLISAMAGLFMLVLTRGPKSLETLLVITIVSGAVMMITTFWWKISIHASSLAGAVTILVILYGTLVLPAFLLLLPLGWSRVVLRRHTVAQVITGSIVSIILSSMVFAIRGV